MATRLIERSYSGTTLSWKRWNVPNGGLEDTGSVTVSPNGTTWTVDNGNMYCAAYSYVNGQITVYCVNLLTKELDWLEITDTGLIYPTAMYSFTSIAVLGTSLYFHVQVINHSVSVLMDKTFRISKALGTVLNTYTTSGQYTAIQAMSTGTYDGTDIIWTIERLGAGNPTSYYLCKYNSNMVYLGETALLFQYITGAYAITNGPACSRAGMCYTSVPGAGLERTSYWPIPIALDNYTDYNVGQSGGSHIDDEYLYILGPTSIPHIYRLDTGEDIGADTLFVGTSGSGRKLDNYLWDDDGNPIGGDDPDPYEQITGQPMMKRATGVPGMRSWHPQRGVGF
jgi:hypothetical protein